jgi:hypothetical protein
VNELGTVLAFVAEPKDAPLEVRVNFGLFAGREATPAEIDELAAELLPKVGEVTIVREERHEISEHSEGSVSLVRIALPSQDPELAGRVAEIAERWARNCFEDRHVDLGEP